MKYSRELKYLKTEQCLKWLFWGLAPRVLFIPLQRCGPARMLPVWKCWSCPVAAEAAGCSFRGSRSKPRWSYPAAPPLGRRTHQTHSSLLWLWSRSLLLYCGGHFSSSLQKEKRRRRETVSYFTLCLWCEIWDIRYNVISFPSTPTSINFNTHTNFIHPKMINCILNVITFPSCDITPKMSSTELVPMSCFCDDWENKKQNGTEVCFEHSSLVMKDKRQGKGKWTGHKKASVLRSWPQLTRWDQTWRSSFNSSLQGKCFPSVLTHDLADWPSGDVKWHDLSCLYICTEVK